jgi:hypothetical protein
VTSVLPSAVEVPLPRAKPTQVAALGDAPLPDDAPSEQPPPMNLARVDPGYIPVPQPSPAVETSCLAVLASMGVELERVGRIKEGSCGMDSGLKVSGIGSVGFSTSATITCETAREVAEWMRDTVQPTAMAQFGQRVTQIRVAASYSCRNRNNAKEGQISEHAFGNAIDISAFEVNGKWVVVGGDNSASESRFLSSVRKAACGPFKTVLGPGSDAHHSDHFHLDLAQRRNGSTYCR